jgi:SAM-dependent methyltransferase
MGLGKPVMVSEVGAFAEFPDHVCVKVPVGGHEEEELIFEYLRYLTENPEAATVIGQSAREWVAENCNWNRVAEEYLAFCERVATDTWLPPVPLAETEEKTARAIADAPRSTSREVAPAGPDDEPEAVTDKYESAEEIPGAGPGNSVTTEIGTEADVTEPEESVAQDGATGVETTATEKAPEESAEDSSATADVEVPPAAPAPILMDLDAKPVIPQLEHPIAQEMISWAPNDAARQYLMLHLSRLIDTIELLPEGDESSRILEMGCYMQITPLLQQVKHYGEVRGCYFGKLGKSREQEAVAPDGRRFSCVVDEFDAERDPYPYPDDHFDAVVCTELFEHLGMDPMHCLWEINRILKPGGCVLLSTPNVCSLRAIAAILGGYHPGFFPAFIKPGPDGPSDPRHHREYAPREIRQGLEDAGFTVTTLTTGAYWSAPAPEHAWVEHLLDRYELDTTQRGECIFALGKKTSAPRVRYPQWLYYL